MRARSEIPYRGGPPGAARTVRADCRAVSCLPGHRTRAADGTGAPRGNRQLMTTAAGSASVEACAMRLVRPPSRAWWLEACRLPGRVQLAGDLARGVVSEEPADRFGGGGKVLGVLPRLQQLGGRRECGDLAAGLGRVVLIDSGQDEHRRAEGPHLVPGHADGEVRSPHRGGERLDLIAAEIVALAHELLTPLLPQIVKELPVARDDPDRLLEYGRDDSFRREFAQLQDERAAD